MFETICDLIPRDPDYSARSRMLDILKRVLDGTLYDVLPHQFHEERGAGGEYIPLRNRRPSVRYALSRIVVEDSVALLFSEGHFPAIDCTDPTIRGVFADLVKDSAAQPGDDRGGAARLDRLGRDPDAGAPRAAVLQRAGHHLSRALLGSGSPGHPDCGARKVQGHRRATGSRRICDRRSRGRILVHAPLGSADGDLVPAGTGGRRSGPGDRSDPDGDARPWLCADGVGAQPARSLGIGRPE